MFLLIALVVFRSCLMALLQFPWLLCVARGAANVFRLLISTACMVLLSAVFSYRRVCVAVAAVLKFCSRSCCCHRFRYLCRPFLWTIRLVSELTTVYHRRQAFILSIWFNLLFSDFRGLLSIRVNVEDTQNQNYNTLCINYLRSSIFSFKNAMTMYTKCIILESPICCNTLTAESVVTECRSLSSCPCIHEGIEHQLQYLLSPVFTVLVSRNRLTQHLKSKNITSNDRNNMLNPGLAVEKLNQVLIL
ncbi:uncharacterized protein LOC113549754 [Rhopalosiphum maidis]|uniref:uncharacterized protein LOC113549754 n=1 Tax=Rhopalosiphum maidis TaxID=43146 RepID=UPI000EFFDBD8|nr:uncharacterized protein LOC113549754 [Rhopalosiphum maidis]